MNNYGLNNYSLLWFFYIVFLYDFFTWFFTFFLWFLVRDLSYFCIVFISNILYKVTFHCIIFFSRENESKAFYSFYVSPTVPPWITKIESFVVFTKSILRNISIINILWSEHVDDFWVDWNCRWFGHDY